MKADFTLSLFNDDKTIRRLYWMNKLEAMFSDERNVIPDEYYFFSDDIPLGSSIRVTFELLGNSPND